MLYIVSFSFEQVRDARHDEGGFQVLLHAADVDAAVASVKRYLVELQESRRSELFEGNVTLFLDSIVELKGPLARPVLVNYASRESVQGPRGSIHCDIVDGAEDIASYAWGPDGYDPEGDEGHEIEAFLEFGSRTTPSAVEFSANSPARDFPGEDAGASKPSKTSGVGRGSKKKEPGASSKKDKPRS